MTATRSPLWLFGAFVLVVLVIYAPVIGGKPFVDDWVYVFQEPAKHIAGAFTHLHPYVFYRPVPLVLTSALQMVGGGSPVPVHLFSFLVHALLAGVVVWLAGRLGVPRRGALVAGMFVAVTQAAAASVGGYDTLSISLATLFGTAAVGSLVGRARIGTAMLLYAAALMCKESALGYLPLLAVGAMRAYPPLPRAADTPSPVRRTLAVALGLLVMTAVYLMWRSHLGGFGPTTGTGVYNMSVGPGMIRNLAMLWFAALLPVSSVDVFTAVSQHHLPGIILGVVAAGGVLALALAGFVTGGRRMHAVALIVAASVVVLPVLPLNRVSELYAYAMLPFVALLLGESVAMLSRRSRAADIAASVLLVAILLANTSAAGSKARAMKRSGEQSERLLRDILGEIASLPPRATLVLVEPKPATPNYSVFRVCSFLLVPDETIIERSGRSDVKIVRVPVGESTVAEGENVYTATLDEDARWVVITRD